MSEALAYWRQEAVEQMVEAARRRGANAVLGMRFDNREISSYWAEICAYGTAVRVEDGRPALATAAVPAVPVDADRPTDGGATEG
jgi:hypothetical protein